MIDATWLPALVGLGSIALIVSMIVMWFRFRASPPRALGRAYSGVTVWSSPQKGLVHARFHTYYGLLVFTFMNEHSFWATPEDARLVLLRLHRFNLTWGMFAYGALFIPIVSYLNYLLQLRSIKRQAVPADV